MKLRTLACLIGAIAISSAPFVLAVTGGGFPSSPTLQYLGVGRVPSSGQTRIVTDNGGSGDSEIVIGSTTAGDTYLRTVPLGTTNWSAGTQRSSSQYRICNAVGMSGTCYTYTGAGAFTAPGSITASAGNLSANAASGGVQVAVTNTDAVDNGVFSQGDFCNSSHCLHTLITGTAQSTAFLTNGVAGEAAYVYTDVIPLCIATASNCRLLIDGSGNITAPGAGTVPWAKPPCIIKITFSGTTPSVNSSSGCASPSVSRGSVGSYTFTDANITGLIGVCTPNSSSSGPYLQDLVSIGGGSALVNNLAVPGTASVLADIPSGASLTCRFDR